MHYVIGQNLGTMENDWNKQFKEKKEAKAVFKGKKTSKGFRDSHSLLPAFLPIQLYTWTHVPDARINPSPPKLLAAPALHALLSAVAGRLSLIQCWTSTAMPLRRDWVP